MNFEKYDQIREGYGERTCMIIARAQILLFEFEELPESKALVVVYLSPFLSFWREKEFPSLSLRSSG